MAVNEIEVRIKDRSKTAAIAETASLCGRYIFKMAGDWTPGASGFVALHRIKPPHGVVPKTYDGAIPFPPSPTEECEVYLIAPIVSGFADVSLKNDLLVADLMAYYGADAIAEIRATFYEKDDDDNLSMAGSGYLQVKVTQPYGELTPAGGFEMFKGGAGEQGESGEEGESAYEIAVRNGYGGTEVEWIASLVGPAGSVQYVLNPETGKYHQLTAKTNILGQVILGLSKTGIDTPPAVGEFTARAEAAALRAETAEDEIPTKKAEALAAIEDAKTAAIGNTSTEGSIVKAQADAVAAVGTAQTTAVAAVGTAKDAAIGDAASAGTILGEKAAALGAIEDAKEEAVGDGTTDGAIQAATADALTSISQAATSAIGDQSTAGSILGVAAQAVEDVTQTGEVQVQRVEDVASTAVREAFSVVSKTWTITVAAGGPSKCYVSYTDSTSPYYDSSQPGKTPIGIVGIAFNTTALALWQAVVNQDSKLITVSVKNNTSSAVTSKTVTAQILMVADAVDEGENEPEAVAEE